MASRRKVGDAGGLDNVISSPEVGLIDLSQPELLSKEVLLQVLSARHICKTLNGLQKEELVELFHKYIVPLPRRVHRENRRGKLMLQAQSLQDSSIEEERTTRGANGENDTSKVECERQSGESRMKPCPLVTEGPSRRVIKLSHARIDNASQRKAKSFQSPSDFQDKRKGSERISLKRTSESEDSGSFKAFSKHVRAAGFQATKVQQSQESLNKHHPTIVKSLADERFQAEESYKGKDAEALG
ncbi:unnamed protein product [Darwinula stevensoni]|uniref:Ashwin n=1 Tax=Darwinula stevensoni TaxID=69355 RepID=A0A7R8XLW3_9CRUS|nr:unnamed protein product [Darwinula stevensoni]CAG0894780.1 unnamed protein product [Darwinula stevensoni]